MSPAFALAVFSGVLPPFFVLASERLMMDGLSISRSVTTKEWLYYNGNRTLFVL